MLAIPPAVDREFAVALDRKPIPAIRKPFFSKWLMDYLDVCDRFNHLPNDKDSRDAFWIKQGGRGQDSLLKQQAVHAVAIYRRIQASEKEADPSGDPLDSCQSEREPT